MSQTGPQTPSVEPAVLEFETEADKGFACFEVDGAHGWVSPACIPNVLHRAAVVGIEHQAAIPRGTLYVDILKADDLRDKGKLVVLDPYVVVRVGSKEHKTQVVNETNSPVFTREETSFELDGEVETMSLVVKNRKRFGSDQEVGCRELPLVELAINRSVANKVIYRLDRKGEFAGLIHLRVSFVPRTSGSLESCFNYKHRCFQYTSSQLTLDRKPSFILPSTEPIVFPNVYPPDRFRFVVQENGITLSFVSPFFSVTSLLAARFARDNLRVKSSTSPTTPASVSPTYSTDFPLSPLARIPREYFYLLPTPDATIPRPRVFPTQSNACTLPIDYYPQHPGFVYGTFTFKQKDGPIATKQVTAATPTSLSYVPGFSQFPVLFGIPPEHTPKLKQSIVALHSLYSPPALNVLYPSVAIQHYYALHGPAGPLVSQLLEFPYAPVQPVTQASDIVSDVQASFSNMTLSTESKNTAVPSDQAVFSPPPSYDSVISSSESKDPVAISITPAIDTQVQVQVQGQGQVQAPHQVPDNAHAPQVSTFPSVQVNAIQYPHYPHPVHYSPDVPIPQAVPYQQPVPQGEYVMGVPPMTTAPAAVHHMAPPPIVISGPTPVMGTVAPPSPSFAPYPPQPQGVYGYPAAQSVSRSHTPTPATPNNPPQPVQTYPVASGYPATQTLQPPAPYQSAAPSPPSPRFKIVNPFTSGAAPPSPNLRPSAAVNPWSANTAAPPSPQASPIAPANPFAPPSTVPNPWGSPPSQPLAVPQSVPANPWGSPPSQPLSTPPPAPTNPWGR